MLADLIGIPWSKDGHDYDGCSCWGLVRLFFRTERATELPAVTDGQAMQGLFEPVKRPAFGDVLLFRVGRLGRHVGVALDQNEMLHVDECKESCIESYRGLAWNKRLIGVYRYRTSV